MIDTRLAAFALASIAAGGMAYVFVYPWLTGDAVAEKRQKALSRPSAERRDRIASATRRDQITLAQCVPRPQRTGQNVAHQLVEDLFRSSWYTNLRYHNDVPLYISGRFGDQALVDEN